VRVLMPRRVPGWRYLTIPRLQQLAQNYKKFAPASGPAVLDTLTSPGFAGAVGPIVGGGTSAPRDITAFTPGNRSFNTRLDGKLTEVWASFTNPTGTRPNHRDAEGETHADVLRTTRQGRRCSRSLRACHTL